MPRRFRNVVLTERRLPGAGSSSNAQGALIVGEDFRLWSEPLDPNLGYNMAIVRLATRPSR